MALLYGLVLVLHIASVVVAFGTTSAYPFALRQVRHRDPQALPAVHRAQRRLGTVIVTPAAALVLLTGSYLATAGGYWGELWVSLPLSILVFLLGLLGAFFAPTERRLERLASRALAEAGTGKVAVAGAYAAVARRLTAVSYLSSVAALVALGLMVLKPS